MSITTVTITLVISIVIGTLGIKRGYPETLDDLEYSRRNICPFLMHFHFCECFCPFSPLSVAKMSNLIQRLNVINRHLPVTERDRYYYAFTLVHFQWVLASMSLSACARLLQCPSTYWYMYTHTHIEIPWKVTTTMKMNMMSWFTFALLFQMQVSRPVKE